MSRTRRPTAQGLANGQPDLHLGAPCPTHPSDVHIDEVPEGVFLSAGMTATVQIDPRPQPQAK